MATASITVNSKGPIIDPALCRCCRSIKKCRLMTVEYEWQGTKEVYSDMIMDCFGLVLSHLEDDKKTSCVCATCVVRLREACAFRQQVLRCEEAFLGAKLHAREDGKIEVVVKTEPVCDMESDSHMDDRDGLSDNEIGLETNHSIIKENNVITEAQCNDVITRSKKRVLKRDLIGKVRKLRDKLDNMLEKPVPTRKREKTTPKTKKKTELDHDNMIHSNAVTVVVNSFVCPFQNRISIYYCYYCKDQFTNPSELRDHTMTHNPTEEFESMMEYKKIPKIDITRIDCRLCPEKIDDIESFKTHISTIHGKIIHPVSNEFLKFRLTLTNLTCTECPNSFPYFDSLKKHMTDHFGTFICDICGACFLEQSSLRTHIKSHSKIEANYPCEVCGKNLKSKYSRFLHIATVHEKKATINCYKCDATFLSYALRNRHLIEVHGDKRTFPCKLCDKVYNRRKTLMEHNRRNHLKVYRHQCDLCDQRFYLPSRLKEHMATHTGERNFRCEFCDKSYPRLQSLQEHVRSHSNERRYKCDVCNSSFTQNGSLKNHMKSHHQGYDLNTNFS